MKIVILEGSPNKNGSSNMLGDDWTFEALEAHYRILVRYLNFTDMGTVLGKGCGTPSMTADSKYPKLAYQLGKGLV